MQNEKDWYEQILEKIAAQNLSKKDFKFLQIERFLRAARRIDQYAITESCLECEHLKQTAEDIATNLSDYITDSRLKKIEFENKFDDILHHLKDTHKVIPYSYFIALYSILGMLAGAALGGALGMLHSIEMMKIGGLIGSAIGLLIGRIIGSRKTFKANCHKR